MLWRSFWTKMKLSNQPSFILKIVWQVHRHRVSGSSAEVASCLVCVGSMGLIALVEDKEPGNIDKVKTYFDSMIDKNDMNQWLKTSHDPIVETEWLLHIASIFWLIVCVNSLSARCFRWKHGRWNWVLASEWWELCYKCFFSLVLSLSLQISVRVYIYNYNIHM